MVQNRVVLSALALSSAVNGLTYEAYDDTGASAVLLPFLEKDSNVVDTLVDPAATVVNMAFGCEAGLPLTMNGSSIKPDTDYPITRLPPKAINADSQPVEVKCGNESHMFLIKSDWTEDELVTPTVELSNGATCEIITGTFGEKIVCPRPSEEQEDGSEAMLQFSLTKPQNHVKYVIHDSYYEDYQHRTRETTQNSVLMRINGGKSAPLSIRKNSLSITAVSGRNQKTWPLDFGGSVYHTIMFWLGSFFAIVNGALVAACGAIAGSAVLSRAGWPIAAPQALSSSILLSQVMSTGSTVATQGWQEALTTPLKWASLQWPAFVGGTVGEDSNKQYSMFGIGDVSSVNNNLGAIEWTALILGGFALAHFGLNMTRNTNPHRYTMGGYESRIFLLLAYPVVLAATLLAGKSGLYSPVDEPSVAYGLIGTVVLLSIIAYAAFATYKIYDYVSSGRVTWVWENSVHEASAKSDNQGRWMDAVCDQLVSQPTHYGPPGFLRNLFALRQTTFVGDINSTPVVNAPTSVNNRNVAAPRIHCSENESQSLIYPPQKLADYPHRANGVAQLKAPALVEITTADTSSLICRGSRQVAGLLRTRWLDMLLTSEAVTHYMRVDNNSSTIPLIVKTDQLSGPYSEGIFGYFFDGVRVPAARLVDLWVKIVMGVFVGAAILTDDEKSRAVLYGFVAAIAFASAIFVCVVKAYTRCIENMGTTVVYTAIGIVACLWSRTHDENTQENGNAKMGPLGSSIATWIFLITSLLVSAVCLALIITAVSALLMPSMDESAFLEQLANSDVHITLDDGTDVTVPGYSKINARHLVQQTKKAFISRYGTLEDLTIELDQNDVREACSTGDVKL